MTTKDLRKLCKEELTSYNEALIDQNNHAHGIQRYGTYSQNRKETMLIWERQSTRAILHQGKKTLLGEDKAKKEFVNYN